MSPYTKEALEAQVQHWREEAKRQYRARIMEAIVGLVALGALISFTLWYTAWAQAQSDKRWCEFMVPLDQRYQKLLDDPNAITNPDTKEFADRLHFLVKDRLNC
jgi:hypothetical protein